MKSFLLLLALSLLMPLTALGETADPVTLLVATDLHYLAPELTDHGPCFERSITHGDGKVMAYSEELVEAFVTQVIDQHPDALILSGDLSFNGERASHEALADKLARVEAAGIPVLVIPGNHDLNSRNAVRFEAESYERVDSVTAEDFRAIYQPFGYDGALSRDSSSLSYVAGISDSLRVLMVDVNTSDLPGAAGPQTVAWIQEQLAQARRDGCRVITVSHQNLINHSDLLTAGYSIVNANVLRMLYADAPVLCNLSGHIHMQHMNVTNAGIWDIATSSLAVAPNQYGVLTVSERGLSYRTEAVDVSAWAASIGLSDPNLLDFSHYSEGFFKANARRQALAVVTQDESPEQLADFFADINAAYFAGRMDTFAPDTQLLARWQQQPVHLAEYIDSIVQDSPRNQCVLTLTLDSTED